MVEDDQEFAELGLNSLHPQRVGNGGVEDGEFGVDADLECVSSQEPGAKLVKGADGCGVESAEDRAPAVGIMTGGELAPAAVADADAELASGFVGEGESDQGAERASAVVFKCGQEPLGEDRGLAAAGAGRERDARAVDFERGLLLGSEAATFPCRSR